MASNKIIHFGPNNFKSKDIFSTKVVELFRLWFVFSLTFNMLRDDVFGLKDVKSSLHDRH